MQLALESRVSLSRPRELVEDDDDESSDVTRTYVTSMSVAGKAAS
jgi:hypothetical protein